MKPRPIAPRSPVMLALDILEGRVKAPVSRKATKKADPAPKPAAKKNPRKKGPKA